MRDRLRSFVGLALGAGVAYLGSLILGEYPFTGWLPVAGGFLLGVSVVGTVAFVERGDPPRWATAVGMALAAWGEWRAAWIDAGGVGPLPGVAWVAVGAAVVGAGLRLIPPRRRGPAPVEPGKEAPAEPEEGVAADPAERAPVEPGEGVSPES